MKTSIDLGLTFFVYLCVTIKRYEDGEEEDTVRKEQYW